LDYYEKILLEKEIQLRIALDQIELLKKRTTKNGIKGSKSDVRWRTVAKFEVQELKIYRMRKELGLLRNTKIQETERI